MMMIKRDSMTIKNNSCKYLLMKIFDSKDLQLDLYTFGISIHHLTFLIPFQILYSHAVLSFLNISYIMILAERCSRIVTATV